MDCAWKTKVLPLVQVLMDENIIRSDGGIKCSYSWKLQAFMIQRSKGREAAEGKHEL